ncbi:MAG TPA: hypothetical protein VHC22_28350 [Pirellulales bacterium]|nr:hypothetical protein [Pirellulales bacterium]
MNRIVQFRLRTLFIATAAVALLLGLWRLLGSRIEPALVIGLEVALALAWRRRWFYVWFLPVLWSTIAWYNFHHPGDEYGGFFFGSLAGLWIIPFVDSDSVTRAALFVGAAGAATMATVGYLLDKSRAPLVPWALLLAVIAAYLFVESFGAFPSAERALAKNGSYEAYILFSLNGGFTLATGVMLLGTGIYRGFARIGRRWRRPIAMPNG